MGFCQDGVFIVASKMVLGTLLHPSQTLSNHAKKQGREIPSQKVNFLIEIRFTIPFFVYNS